MEEMFVAQTSLWNGPREPLALVVVVAVAAGVTTVVVAAAVASARNATSVTDQATWLAIVLKMTMEEEEGDSVNHRIVHQGGVTDGVIVQTVANVTVVVVLVELRRHSNIE